MKRIFDLLIVIVFAPLWLPVAGVVALAVWLKLGRPVLFAQDRAGLNDREQESELIDIVALT